ANRRAVELWAERAGGRRTIAFAANVEHALALEGAWKAAGVAAETLTGETPGRDRVALLERLTTGETQVVTNCAVLTEGFAEALTKTCPDCAAELPVAVMACPLCGYEFPKNEEEEVPAADQEDPIRRARLIEVDLLNRSPFAWENMGDDGLVAVGFHAQAAV